MPRPGARPSLNPRLSDGGRAIPAGEHVADLSPRLPLRLWMTRAAVALIWTLTAVATVASPLDTEPAGRWLRVGMLVALCAVALWAARIVNRAIRETHSDYVQRLERLAAEDDLTGLANRRAFNVHLSREFLRARRYGHPFSVVLVDLDGFKSINDTHGHPAGDCALVTFAGVLTSITRASDIAARLGGDEFALLLPETDAEDARRVVRRLKDALAARPVVIDTAQGFEVHLEVSAGAATLGPEIENESKLLAAADRALYDDKRGHE